MGIKRSFSVALFLLICICMESIHADTTDSLTQGQQLTDWQSLVSPKGFFQLSFFSTRLSRNRYLGIRYNKMGLWAVWIANPDTPIVDSSGVLTIDNNGRLKLTYSGGNPIVLNSDQAGTSSTSNVTAKLLDSGNFVLTEANSNGTAERVLWQSFDYPSDTLLPGMKLGVNFKTGHKWSITSWTSDQVPALGAYTLGGDPNGSSQLYIWKRGQVYWTSGVWNGQGFNNIPELSSNNRFSFSYVSNVDEKYFTFSVKDNSISSMWVMDLWGQIAQYPFGSIVPCGENSSSLGPGCVEQKMPKCRGNNEWFEAKRGYLSTGLPIQYDEDQSLGSSDCEAKCWKNCSCYAFAARYEDGTGCIFGLDKLSFVEGSEYDVYVLHSGQGKSTKKKWWIWLIISVAAALLMFFLGFIFYLKRRNIILKGKKETCKEQLVVEVETNITPKKKLSNENELEEEMNKDHEVQLFDFAIIMTATDNFSSANKLGEGGFGPVYKGKLLGGQEIAVKRLSISSMQGLEEFKNEVILIAKLQHMSLVRLLGCCFQGEERMLIYEYMPNKSLDSFLFDPTKRELLDWRTRFNIIEGIAQGLLYLHKYSRLRIVHRDIKASNILLDDQMNPKISDFGMARIFGQNESEAKTNRVVGTYGYMSPEYAIEGTFSVKSDVFSFGVLLLEIISGKKNSDSYFFKSHLNLIGYAWELWKEGIILELMDPTLGAASCLEHELLICIHVGLLCVQDSAEDRPTMSDVLSILSNEITTLPTPKQPVFSFGRGIEANVFKTKSEDYSINDVTISVLEAR